jgi:hypothetical protein
MTPKEKAQELFDKYKVEVGRFLAIQCALIAVDEIMSALTYLPYGLDYLNKISYWEDVKQEIEKL